MLPITKPHSVNVILSQVLLKNRIFQLYGSNCAGLLGVAALGHASRTGILCMQWFFSKTSVCLQKHLFTDPGGQKRYCTLLCKTLAHISCSSTSIWRDGISQHDLQQCHRRWQQTSIAPAWPMAHKWQSEKHQAGVKWQCKEVYTPVHYRLGSFRRSTRYI